MAFEVKADRNAKWFNSFFIDFYNKNKFSGIYITTADFHRFTNTTDFYLIKTDHLHDLLLEREYSIKATPLGTQGFILPIEDLKKVCYSAITNNPSSNKRVSLSLPSSSSSSYSSCCSSSGSTSWITKLIL